MGRPAASSASPSPGSGPPSPASAVSSWELRDYHAESMKMGPRLLNRPAPDARSSTAERSCKIHHLTPTRPALALRRAAGSSQNRAAPANRESASRRTAACPPSSGSLSAPPVPTPARSLSEERRSRQERAPTAVCNAASNKPPTSPATRAAPTDARSSGSDSSTARSAARRDHGGGCSALGQRVRLCQGRPATGGAYGGGLCAGERRSEPGTGWGGGSAPRPDLLRRVREHERSPQHPLAL